MIDLRIWHSSRDAYHCAFRILRLLTASHKDVTIEKLRILDMYLLFPSLLHRTSMPREMKREFSSLEIEKPSDKFIRLPSNAAIFQELRLYQNAALAQLFARGLILPDAFKKSLAKIDPIATPPALAQRISSKNQSEEGLVKFLINALSELPLRGRESLYRRAGLPTRTFSE